MAHTRVHSSDGEKATQRKQVPCRIRSAQDPLQPSATVNKHTRQGLSPVTGSSSSPGQSTNTVPAGTANDRFRMSDVVLGSGQFGVVRECWDSLTGNALACKTIALPSNNASSAALLQSVRGEVGVLARLAGGEGVVQLRRVLAQDGVPQVHLLMDLCRGGDLFDEILRRQCFCEADAAPIFAEIVRAVAFCHSRGVLHRDLKPENILLPEPLPGGVPLADVASRGPLAKVADFGLARTLNPGEKLSGASGSPFYVAPEVLTGEYDTLKADVWSLGVILYTMLAGRQPFWGATDAELFDAILHESLDLSGPAWEGVSGEGKSVLQWMLHKNPSCRPSAQQLLVHPWLVGSTRAGQRLLQAASHSAGMEICAL